MLIFFPMLLSQNFKRDLCTCRTSSKSILIFMHAEFFLDIFLNKTVMFIKKYKITKYLSKLIHHMVEN